MEGLAKTEAGGEGTNDGNQRIVDGYPSHRIQAEQLVVERESDGRDGDEQQQADDAKRVDMRQRTAKSKAGNDEQQASDEETIARSYEDVYPTAQPTGHQVREGSTDGIEDDHAVTHPGILTTIGPTKIQCEDAAEAYSTAKHLT